MRRNRLFLRPWARGLVLFAVLTQVVVACGEPELTYSEVPFELDDGRTSWKGNIIGLVAMPRMYLDEHFGQSVSPEQAAEIQAGHCVAILGELSPVRINVPDIFDVPGFWLPALEGGSPIGGRSRSRCDMTEVRAAGYWFYTLAGIVPAGRSFPFYIPYYIEGAISEPVIVSIESLYGDASAKVETSMLAAIPSVTWQSSTGTRLIEMEDMDTATFAYTQTWGSDTITWSVDFGGLIEYDLRSGYVLSETNQGWSDPRWQCIAVVGSATLSHEGVEKPQWLDANPLMMWPSIGLVADGRVINREYYQCPYLPSAYDLAGLTIEDPGPGMMIFSVPHDVEVEGVMVNPWGDESARYGTSSFDAARSR